MQKDKYQCSRDLNHRQHVIQLCAMLHKSNGRGTNHKQKAFANTGMLLYGIFLLNLKAYRLITVHWQPQNHFISFCNIIQIYQHSTTCIHMYASQYANTLGDSHCTTRSTSGMFNPLATTSPATMQRNFSSPNLYYNCNSKK